MGFYNSVLLPHLIAVAMRQRDLAAYRQRVVPAARGRVLEVGIGSGLNLPFYRAAVDQVFGLGPSHKLLAMTRKASRGSRLGVSLIEGAAEALPLKDKAVDTVVMTWTLCSVPRPLDVLGEIRRVLRPSGELLLVEHGLAPEPRIASWQHRITPVWKHIGAMPDYG